MLPNKLEDLISFPVGTGDAWMVFLVLNRLIKEAARRAVVARLLVHAVEQHLRTVEETWEGSVLAVSTQTG